MITKEEFLRRVGARLAADRKAKINSIEELANAIGIRTDDYQAIERGKRDISFWEMARICEATGRLIEFFVADIFSEYGKCPHCGSPCKERERRPGGNDTCEEGHVYPSSASIME